MCVHFRFSNRKNSSFYFRERTERDDMPQSLDKISGIWAVNKSLAVMEIWNIFGSQSRIFGSQETLDKISGIWAVNKTLAVMEIWKILRFYKSLAVKKIWKIFGSQSRIYGVNKMLKKDKVRGLKILEVFKWWSGKTVRYSPSYSFERIGALS